MFKQINLIGYPCGWGARDLGCTRGPSTLQAFGLANVLQRHAIAVSWLRLPHSDLPTKPLLQMRDALIQDYQRLLTDQLVQTLQDNGFPLIFGGDHTVACATWPTVINHFNDRTAFGLLWIDAHMDAHTPATSQTGNPHGMPLAWLLEHGIKPEYLYLFATRTYDPEEHALLQQHKVRVIDMEEIRCKGFSTVWHEVLADLSPRVSGLGISLDMDAFSPEVAPGTGYHEPNGLLKDEVLSALHAFAHHPKLRAIEFAEFDPQQDQQQKTAQLIVDLIDTMFDKE